MTPEEQFTSMIQANEGVIFKVSTVYTRTLQDQEDLYQEIVVQLWRSFEKYRGEARISTWIYRIALNTAITRLRQAKRKIQAVPINQAVLQRTEPSDPVFEERVRLLYRYIEGLNDLDKGIILLYLEDRSHEEISEIIGISVSNVSTRLSRIRQKMKKAFAHDQP